jgi:hypothetical protein
MIRDADHRVLGARQRLGRLDELTVFRCRSIAGFGCPPTWPRHGTRTNVALVGALTNIIAPTLMLAGSAAGGTGETTGTADSKWSRADSGPVAGADAFAGAAPALPDSAVAAAAARASASRDAVVVA